MRLLILILTIPLLWLACPAQASIVEDPAALEKKLEEMRQVRMEKQVAEETYWEDYRRNYKPQPVKLCTRVYTDKGTFRKCRWEMR